MHQLFNSSFNNPLQKLVMFKMLKIPWQDIPKEIYCRASFIILYSIHYRHRQWSHSYFILKVSSYMTESKLPPLSKHFAVLFESRDKKMQWRFLSRAYPISSPQVPLSLPVPISVLLKEKATSLSMPREPSWLFFSLINMQENSVSFRQIG